MTCATNASPTRRKALYAFHLITLCLILGLSGPGVAKAQGKKGNPNASCPSGTTLIAKFELSGEHYVFEKPSGNEGIVQLTGDAQQGSWTSTQPIEQIVLKGARDTDVLHANGATSGSFTNLGLRTRSGRPAGISNVQFCGDGGGTPPPPPPPPPPVSGCGDCEGKVSSLTLRYNGTTPALIDADIVVPKPKGADDVFVGVVPPGGTFTVVGPANRGGNGFDGTLGNELRLNVDGQFNTQIHTSCSQPVHPGLTFGDFTIVDAFSKNGGRIGDPTDTTAPQVVYSFTGGPDKVEGTADDEIRIDVTDDVALQLLDVTLIDADGGSPNLFVIENTFTPGVPSAFVRLGFNNFTQNTLVLVDASDGCNACADTQAPHVADPIVLPGPVLRFVVTDETGLRKVEPFRLGSAFTLISTPLSINATQYDADFAITGPGGTLGLLAADACNAFVYDPTLECTVTAGGGSCAAASATGKRSRGNIAIAEGEAVPGAFVLEENYPNPFNPSTQISFSLAEAAEVELAVYDVAGRLVQRLASGAYAAGRHTVTFEAGSLPSGIYFYRLQSGGAAHVRPMTLLK